MTLENQPFEDVSPTRNGDVPASHVSFRRGKSSLVRSSSCKKHAISDPYELPKPG